MNKKINVVPWTVKILLKVIESINCDPGKNSSARIKSARAPPKNKNDIDKIR
jgi:hypothetical protein